MAATRPDVTVSKSTWIDLYAASGIPVGTPVTVFNKGINRAYLAIKASVPPTPTMLNGTTLVPTGVPLFTGQLGSCLVVGTGEVGLWVFSQFGTIVLVQE